ncbi:hypothetical protein DID88_007307 [Monilinia fructigena]|uniref:Uncharacterized protein n=1 Tax=Monilinia fructigena TaxID=38457 RepID=A0A395J8X7_9HELO|nr:hypothetical protein DID88_007307 [Monilinia fructigena]
MVVALGQSIFIALSYVPMRMVVNEDQLLGIVFMSEPSQLLCLIDDPRQEFKIERVQKERRGEERKRRGEERRGEEEE